MASILRSPKQKVADKVRAQRQKLYNDLRNNKIGQKELASVLGITASAVSYQLNGDSRLSFETYVAAQMLLNNEL